MVSTVISLSLARKTRRAKSVRGSTSASSNSQICAHVDAQHMNLDEVTSTIPTATDTTPLQYTTTFGIIAVTPVLQRAPSHMAASKLLPLKMLIKGHCAAPIPSNMSPPTLYIAQYRCGAQVPHMQKRKSIVHGTLFSFSCKKNIPNSTKAQNEILLSAAQAGSNGMH